MKHGSCIMDHKSNLFGNSCILKPRPNDRNMPTEDIATYCWAQHVACVCHPVAMCCDMLGVVGSSSKMVKFESTRRNLSQQGGQTHHATCYAQQCCDMLRWHVAIVWPGLYTEIPALVIYI